MFSEKGGRECGREGWRRKKGRESNYSAGIIINSQLVPRNYSFEGHGRQGERTEKRKRERKRQFRWKINHSPLSLISLLLSFLPKEQIIRPTVVHICRRGLASLFSRFSDHFFFHFFLPCFASRCPLSSFLRSARKLPKNMSVQANLDTAEGEILPNSKERERWKRGEKSLVDGFSKIREGEKRRKGHEICIGRTNVRA